MRPRPISYCLVTLDRSLNLFPKPRSPHLKSGTNSAHLAGGREVLRSRTWNFTDGASTCFILTIITMSFSALLMGSQWSLGGHESWEARATNHIELQMQRLRQNPSHGHVRGCILRGMAHYCPLSFVAWEGTSLREVTPGASLALVTWDKHQRGARTCTKELGHTKHTRGETFLEGP